MQSPYRLWHIGTIDDTCVIPAFVRWPALISFDARFAPDVWGAANTTLLMRSGLMNMPEFVDNDTRIDATSAAHVKNDAAARATDGCH